MLSWLRRTMVERNERKEKHRLQHLVAVLNNGRCDESQAKILVSELALLIRHYAQQLTTENLQKLADLSVHVKGVVGEEYCSGYCNVAPDSPNPGPCLHAGGKIPVYGEVSIDCQEVIMEAQQELERRATS